MLAEPLSFGELGRGALACAWWRERLWVAFEGQGQTLVLRSMDVLGGGTTTRVDTGFALAGIGTVVSMTAQGSRLRLVYGENGVDYRSTSTTDGQAFTAPVQLPLRAGFIGVRSLCAHSGGLSLLWAENAGGRAHLLDVTAGTDEELPFRVGHEPGVCLDPSTGHLVLAYGVRSGPSGSWVLMTVDPSDASTALAELAVETSAEATTLSLCATTYHDTPGLHVAFLCGTSGPTAARSGPADLSRLGGDEPLGVRAFQLDLAHDGRRTWVAWMEDDGEVRAGPYAVLFDLPQELRELLDQPCDPDSCPVDPRLVCAATDEVTWVWQPPRIRNARKGDVIMTPGDGTGLIGTLLEQLEPRQFFDHMGVMLRDEVLVRHATMAHGRLNRKDPGRMMTGSFFGQRAPVDGFRPDALGQGWPGTITQSVDDAFFTGFNTYDPGGGRRYNPQGDGVSLVPGTVELPRPPDGAPPEQWKAWERQQLFADPEFPQDEPFSIHNFPVGPSYRLESGSVIHPVVVKPAPELEAADPRIRGVLHRVADAAAGLRGHYRFYAYSDARIAFDPDKLGTAGTWAEGTRPVVCSSFVWAAVQVVSAAGQRLEVEGQLTESPEELLVTPTVDGLYRYLTAEREKAGTALHELVTERVRREVYLALQEAVHDNQLLVDLARIGLTALIGYVTGPIGAALAILGTSPDVIRELGLAFEDMPDDVATQLCNAFAADRPDETDDDLWATPGEGLAVSPDDIKAYWDAPDGDGDRELWHGLYGTTQKMLLTYGRLEPRTVHRLQRSDGPARVEGTVRYRGEPVVGAEVRYGCDKTVTRRDDRRAAYAMEVSAGRYEVRASAYWPDTQEMLEGTRVVELRAGDQPGPVDLDLEDPPEWRRLVRVTGRIDLVRKVLIGTDDWAHSAINLQSPLTWAPDTWGEPPATATVLTWRGASTSAYAQRFNVRVDLTVTLQQDLTMVVEARSALCEHYYKTGAPPAADQIVTSKAYEPLTIAPGSSASLVFDHDSGNVPPDRGHVELTVTNERQPA
jgi:hypothetical protein